MDSLIPIILVLIIFNVYLSIRLRKRFKEATSILDRTTQAKEYYDQALKTYLKDTKYRETIQDDSEYDR